MGNDWGAVRHAQEYSAVTKIFRSGDAQTARPERFELPTTWFEARCSIQLSYGRKPSV
jgi:hypothetical protein